MTQLYHRQMARSYLWSLEIVRIDWEHTTRFGDLEFPRVTANMHLADDPPATVQVVVELAGGAPAVVEIVSLPDEAVLTGELLRRIPVAEIARQTVGITARKSSRRHALRTPADARREAEHVARALRSGRGTRVTNETLRTAADVYRAAFAEGRPTREAVKDALNIAYSTAGRYISLARMRGFLPPTEERRANA
jgi:hypothetical protein